MRKIAPFFFVTALTLGASSLSAQSWSAVGTPTNGGAAFWDNTSWDGDHCNVGYVLNGTATSVAGPNYCGAQRPGNWLPYSGSNPSHYLNNGSGGYQHFSFAAGTYTFSLLPGAKPGGDIAGMNTAWGYLSGTGYENLNDFDFTTPHTVTFTTEWTLGIQLTNGNLAFSALGGPTYPGNQQFSMFAFDAASTFSAGTYSPMLNYRYGQTYIIGMEDILRAPNNDNDYNDVMFQIQTVTAPEPGTYALLAAGLAALGFVHRRRRNTA